MRPDRLSAVSGPRGGHSGAPCSRSSTLSPRCRLSTILRRRWWNSCPFFRALSPDPEQVIELPKILPVDVPLRTSVREPQLVEQLVEVPPIVSHLKLLGNLSSGSLTVQFHVVVCLVLKVFSQDRATLSQPSRSWTIQFLGRVVVAVLKVYHREQSSTAFSEQIAEFPDPGGGLQDFQPVQGPAASSSTLARHADQWVFRTFSTGKSAKIQRTQGSELGAQSSSWTSKA